ncbi:MAG: AGE family epimerase/isomerase [Bacteroidales bacterium]|jgi:mannobiose 2-epimerase|nr:AGE family epimerase/isomerase [Bacteroidales bacterium]
MKRTLILVLALAACLVLTGSCKSAQKKMAEQLKSEIVDDLENNLLPWWMENVPDDADGFWGEVRCDGTPVMEADRAGILNARILWTFSSAYRVLGKTEYKALADRAAKYYRAHFIDPEYGGSFYQLTPDGEPAQTQKSTYCIAFGIYALSEHYRATGDQASLEAAVGLFRDFEAHIYDAAQGGGYIEGFTRDWQLPTPRPGRPAVTKTMNTHIHVMEGLTNLYRVWPDPVLRDRLFELVEILQTHLYNAETHHLILYCDRDWNSFNNADSYGHDIETSWLLCETAEVLGDKALIEKIRKQAVDMCSTALDEGLRPDNAMMYEKRGDGSYQSFAAWWCQNETVVGCINAWQITGDDRYLEQAVKTWGFIKEYLIDRENGGWFCNLNEDNTPKLQEMKASTWNCPYHNSRMGYEIIARLSK